MPAGLNKSHPLIDLRLSAVLLSCLFSLINIVSNPVLNDDAYGYLRAAEIFTRSGAGALLNNYGWYGYSILIALLNELLPLGYLYCAYLLNIFFYAVLVYAFISLVMEYRRTFSAKLFAALVILVFPLINEMRYFLIRDFAFWAFSMTALLQLVRFHTRLKPRHAIGWCLALLAATFFRLEGIVLLALTPFSLLFNQSITASARVKNFFLVQAILLGAVVLIFMLCSAAGINLPGLIAYAYRYYLPGIFSIPELLAGTASQLSTAIFDERNFPGNSGHGVVILILAYCYTVLLNLLNALSLPLGIFLLYGWAGRRLSLSSHASIPVLFFVASSMLSLLIFMFVMHFLTQRYATLPALILLSLVPLCLDSLYLQAQGLGKTKIFQLVFGIFVFYFAVDSLVSFGYSKRYIHDAANWTRENISTNVQLHTNEYAIAYGSGLVADYDKVPPDARTSVAAVNAGDVLAVSVRYNDAELQALLNDRTDLALLKTFSNKRNDQVRIYQAPAP
ncbi:MAG: hypothetical protein RQ899_02135 [Pseudomonadales bacterium]|nr:hypothetical protein [Pseudomonadales bacterium]